MDSTRRAELTRYLSSFVTPERLRKMDAVLENRTRYVTVVLEDIYQPHNASAVVRTCDALGVHDVHIVEQRNTYTVNPGVALGTTNWVNLIRYPRGDGAMREATAALRANGYRLVATTPHADAVGPADLDLSAGPVALMFGTELDGLSEAALTEADEYVRIPMYGFVESFNISVSAAISLFTLTERLRASDVPWRLTEEEAAETRLAWLRRSIKRAKALESEFHQRR